MEELPQKPQPPTSESANPPEQLLVDIRHFINTGRDRAGQIVSTLSRQLNWFHLLEIILE